MPPGDVVGTYPCPAPSCSGEMVRRTNKTTGGQFYGCNHWPECNESFAIPEREKMRAAGAAELPGFETLGEDA